jgi:unsaturated chondroitin disaccharide hydrolase
MVFWYGAAFGEQCFNNCETQKLVTKAITVLTSSYCPKMHALPLGTAMGGGKEGQQIINIDSLAAVIQLFSCSQQYGHQSILQKHTDTLLKTLGNDNGAFYAYAHFTNSHFKVLGEAGDWTRGQAWAMLGLTCAATRWGSPYLDRAVKACEYWQRTRLNAFPANKLSQPEALCDVSATIIASLAMLSLANLIPSGKKWRNDAHQLISTIIRSAYFTGFGENSEKAGIFWGCCYKTRTGEELVESTWGSFLLMSALCILVDKIKPNQC